MLSSLERMHFYFQCLITTGISKTKTTFIESRMRSCSNELSQKIKDLIYGHPSDEQQQNWRRMLVKITKIKICVIIHVIQSGVTLTSRLCPNQILIAPLSLLSPLFSFTLVYWSSTSVVCLHNAFLRCLPHSDVHIENAEWLQER